jgi:KAP family P-loop domain
MTEAPLSEIIPESASSAPSSEASPDDSAGPSAESAAPSGFRLQMLADAPVDDDLTDRFGYRDIADGLARLIEGEETATPLTIAVSAPWGAGKTSLLRLVENRVVRQRIKRGEAPTIVVWFNAWMHDAAPSISAALAADVARHATHCRDPLVRLWHPLPTSMLSPQERTRRRVWLAGVALVIAVAIYFLAHGLIGPSLTQVAKVQAALGASVAGWFVLAWGLSFLWPRVHKSVAAVAAFVDDPRSAAATGSMSQVAAQLGELIDEARAGVRRAWGVKQRPRFVVVVEDLERCQLPKAVDVCEVVAQLLDHPGVITVLVGDLRVIAASAEVKYKEAAERFGQDPDFAADGLGRFFLQKVVQFELELPPIPEWRLRELVRSAPPTASIYGSKTDRRTPMPSLLRRSERSLLGSAATLAALIAIPVFILVDPAEKLSRGSITIRLSWLGPSWLGPLLGAIVFVFVVSGAGALWSNARRRRMTALRIEVGRLVDSIISSVLADSATAPDSTEVEQEVHRRLTAAIKPEFTSRRYWERAASLTSPEEVRRRLQLRATADEEIRTRAEAVIIDLLPPLPRMAKRLLNRLYFLLVVAWSRNLIADDRVTPEQLGKWAVLLDQWPTAARAINRDPGLAGQLEDAAGQEDAFTKMCARYTPPLARDVEGLRQFFNTSPQVGAVAEHLVYLGANVPARTA